MTSFSKKTCTLIISTAVLAGALISAPAATALNTSHATTNVSVQKAAATVTKAAFTKLATNPVIAAQTTARGQTIQDLAVKNGELYMGYGDYGVNTGPIQITSMNTATKAFTNWLGTPTEEINVYREINGSLYAPQIDPRLAWNAKVGYATNASGSWVTKNQAPFIHVFDVATTDGKDIWMSGSISDETGKVGAGAAVKRSTDGGVTWTTERVATSTGAAGDWDRYYWMASINGKIYTKAQLESADTYQIEVWENGKWSTITDTTRSIPGYVDAHKVVTFKNNVIIGNGSNATLIDATTNKVTQVSTKLNYTYDYYVDEDTIYALGANGISKSTDGKTWALIQTSFPGDTTPVSIAVSEGKIYLGGSNAAIYIADLPGYVAPTVPTPEPTATSIPTPAPTPTVEPTTPPVTVTPTPEPTTPPVTVTPTPTPTATSTPAVNTPPTITGATNITIAQNSTFNPKAGVTANDKEDGDITNKIVATGTVNTAKTGKYNITYTVTDSKETKTSVTRTVTVKANSKPVINGTGMKTINRNTNYDPRAGVTAWDAEDGTINYTATTNWVKGKPGFYTTTYTATDSNGATTTVNTTVWVLMF